jgi:hypothetical protein
MRARGFGLPGIRVRPNAWPLPDSKCLEGQEEATDEAEKFLFMQYRA